MLHVTLFYSTLPLSFSLFRFYFCPVTFLLCIISLRFTLLYALLSSFPSALSRLLCSCSVSLHLFALYMVYFTLLCSIFIPLYSRLLCIASFLYITSLRFTSFRLAFLIFLGPVSAPVLTSSLPGDIARPSIPCSTCFVEPRAILLPLIPLCSVSREPRALEKSEPDWRRYVIYSPCRNETKRRPPFWFYAMHFNRGFNVATARFED